MKRFFLTLCIAGLLVSGLNACGPSSPAATATPIPGFVDTLIVQTSDAAQTQTALYAPTATITLTPSKTPTPLLSNTPTYVFKLNSPTSGKAATATPYTLEAWPNWVVGVVVDMPQGSGEGVGVTKYFPYMVGAYVQVVRQHGVKLRSLPSKAIGGKLAETGSFLKLTGYWNKNKNYYPPFTFIKVSTLDGKEFWVGGSEGDDTDPIRSLIFALPPTPTPSGSETPTPTLFYIIPPKFPTATDTPFH